MKRKLQLETIIPTLPYDVWMEILLYAFHGVDDDARLMEEAIITRETSIGMKVLIDRYILGSVVTVSSQMMNEKVINDNRLLLLTGLRALSLGDLHMITARSLTQMIGLESLDLEEEDGRLDKKVTKTLTNLRNLVIGPDCALRNGFAKTLPKLESLSLNTLRIDTRGLTHSPQLRTLRIDGFSHVEFRTAFHRLTCLQRLELVGDLSIDDDELVILAPSLRELSLTLYTNPFTSGGLAKMSRLKALVIHLAREDDGMTESIGNLTQLRMLDIYRSYSLTDVMLSQLTGLTCLKLCGCNNVTDHALSVLTNLTELRMSHMIRPTDAGLSQLTQLTKIDIDHCRFITPMGLSFLSSRLEVIHLHPRESVRLIKNPPLIWSLPLLCTFPRLKTIHVSSPDRETMEQIAYLSESQDKIRFIVT